MTRSEAQTRTELIDRQLAQSGWNVNDPTQVVEEFDILTSTPDGVAESVSTYGSHQFSDYVLLGKDGKPLAVVEAKRTSKDAAIGREQAKQYCYNIQNQIGILKSVFLKKRSLRAVIVQVCFILPQPKNRRHDFNQIEALEIEKQSKTKIDGSWCRCACRCLAGSCRPLR